MTLAGVVVTSVTVRGVIMSRVTIPGLKVVLVVYESTNVIHLLRRRHLDRNTRKAVCN